RLAGQGAERREADAAGDPCLARRLPALEAAVGAVDLGVHAGRRPRDELARVVAERANQKVHAPAFLDARDRERMRLAKPVLLHTQEAELAGLEWDRSAHRLELELHGRRAG